MKRTVALILTVLMLVTLFCGCESAENRNDIKDLIAKFETSCNQMDINGMLDCINPDVAAVAKAAVGLVGMFANADTDAVLEKLSGLIMNDTSLSGKEFFSSLKIKVGKITVEEDTASVEAVITYTVSGEEKQSETVIECTKRTDNWYIKNL